MDPPPARRSPLPGPTAFSYRLCPSECDCVSLSLRYLSTCHYYYSFSPKTTAEQKTLVRRRVVRDFTRVRNTTRPIIIVIMINPSKEDEKEPSVLLQSLYIITTIIISKTGRLSTKGSRRPHNKPLELLLPAQLQCSLLQTRIHYT